MKKLFSIWMLICILGMVATTHAQAQNIYQGTLEVTVGTSTTTQSTNITITDNTSTATLTLQDVSFPQYEHLNITAIVNKSGEQITGISSIQVTGNPAPKPVKATSANGTIAQNTCDITLNLTAVYIIKVQVHFVGIKK